MRAVFLFFDRRGAALYMVEGDDETEARFVLVFVQIAMDDYCLIVSFQRSVGAGEVLYWLTI